MANFLDLPFEILSYIVSYLPYGDRSSLRLTCKTLFYVCNQKCFVKNEVLVVEDTVVSFEHDPLLCIPLFSKLLRNIDFINVDFKYDSQFWKDHGKYIKKLCLVNSDMNSDCLFYILANCPNLEYLKLEKLTHIFMIFRPSQYKISLPSLKSLEFNCLKYVTDKIFNYFSNMCPSLNNLIIHGCENFCHPGIYKRFYPKKGDECCNPSDSIFSFLYVKHVINLKAIHLTSLDFSKTMINGDYLIAILEIPNLSLKSLNISNCIQLRTPCYQNISRLQPNLKRIFLNNVPGCCSDILKNPLHELTVLEMDGIQSTINVSEAAENSLKNLKQLSLGFCENLYMETIINILFLNDSPDLVKLSLKSIDLSRDLLIKILVKLKYLTSLNLSSLVIAVDDVVIRTICENIILLRELDLTNCEAITDRGLMGIDLEMAPVIHVNESFLRIPLGSKVEVEIKEDVARKREIMQIMSEVTTEPSNLSIKRLQGLKVLSLKNCTRISDLSLKSVFQFKELVSLNLSGCQQITHEGLTAMIKNVNSLEVLDLSSCFNFSDKTVDNICLGLKRLKKLILQDCKQLTDKSLESIFYSNSLRHINVKGCENMNNDFVRNIEEILEQRIKIIPLLKNN